MNKTTDVQSMLMADRSERMMVLRYGSGHNR